MNHLREHLQQRHRDNCLVRAFTYGGLILDIKFYPWSLAHEHKFPCSLVEEELKTTLIDLSLQGLTIGDRFKVSKDRTMAYVTRTNTVCATCSGEGTIDERIGGISTSNPEAPCPDCSGSCLDRHKECFDCKDGYYYPLIGPREPCRTCS